MAVVADPGHAVAAHGTNAVDAGTLGRAPEDSVTVCRPPLASMPSIADPPLAVVRPRTAVPVLAVNVVVALAVLLWPSLKIAGHQRPPATTGAGVGEAGVRLS